MAKSSLLRKVLPGGIIIGGIIVLIILIYHQFSPADDLPLYRLNRADFIIAVEAPGTIQAINSQVINSPGKVWGNIRIIKMVEEGTYVHPGDFLIQFDPAEFKERLREAENNLETAQANYESQLATIEKQRADLASQLEIERYNLQQMELQAKNAVYEAENKRKEIEYALKKAQVAFEQLQDKIESTRAINKAALKQAKLKVEQAELKVQQARDDLAQLTIDAPTEGLVVYREIWGPSGREKVKVGASPWRNQPLLEIPDNSQMKVEILVNEVDISRLARQQRVDIRLDAIADTSFTGRITTIANLAHQDRETEKKVFRIEAQIEGADQRLKPGMSAQCRIIVAEIPDTLFVPLDAVLQRGEQVGVLDEDGDFIPIQTGAANADFIVVTQGLQAGDAIQLQQNVSIKAPTPQQKTVPRKKPETERRVIIHG